MAQRSDRSLAGAISLQRQLARSAMESTEPEWKTELPDGLDPCVIPSNVLDAYFLAKSAVDFSAAMNGVNNQNDIATAQHNYRGDVGSNNWVVSGDRTSTGRRC